MAEIINFKSRKVKSSNNTLESLDKLTANYQNFYDNESVDSSTQQINVAHKLLERGSMASKDYINKLFDMLNDKDLEYFRDILNSIDTGNDTFFNDISIESRRLIWEYTESISVRQERYLMVLVDMGLKKGVSLSDMSDMIRNIDEENYVDSVKNLARYITFKIFN